MTQTTAPPTSDPRADERRWRQSFAGILVAAFVSLLGINLALPFMPLFIQQLGVPDPAAAAAWSGNIQLIAGLFGITLAPVWGQLADRRGRKLMLVRALALPGIAFGLMAFAQNIWHLLALRVLFQGTSGTMPAANAYVASYAPPYRISWSMGILQSVSYLSNTGGPVLGGVLTGAAGFRPAFLVTGALYLASAVVAHLMVKEHFVPPPPRTESMVRAIGREYRAVWRNRQLTLATLALMLTIGVGSALFPVTPVYIQLIAHPASINTAAGIVFGLSGIASALAGVLIGRTLGRFGHRKAIIGAALGMALLTGGLVALPSYWPFALLAAGQGLMMGTLLPAINALIARMAPRGRVASVFGVVFSFQSLGFSFFPFLGGHAVELGGPRAAFALALALALILLIAVAFLHGPGEQAT